VSKARHDVRVLEKIVAGLWQQVPQEKRLAGPPGARQKYYREAACGGGDLPLQLAMQVAHLRFLTSQVKNLKAKTGMDDTGCLVAN
jgi:hypothetical protein